MTERITSRQNPLLRHVTKLLSSRAYRYEQRQFAGDGTKLLAEAAMWCADDLSSVLFTPGTALPALPSSVRLVEIPETLMEKISPMESPQGALFTCRMPEQTPPVLTPGCLILDGLQDPGNLGTIIRTADAFGVPLFLTGGCADPYNPKVVRAAMGALFRTPPRIAEHGQLIAACRERGIPLVCTALREDARDLRGMDLAGAAVVIGNEGRGVSEAMLSGADQCAIIPMTAHCESLNAAVAAAVCMWEVRRESV